MRHGNTAIRLTERRHVNGITGCWEWLGARDNNGYGRINVDGSTRYVHRVSWELVRGPIPADRMIDHVCENRACFNMAHLELVTAAENTNRRQNAPGNRTHCPSGHRYAGENLRVYTDKRGYTHRVCRTCNKIKSRAWQAAKKTAARTAA